jgi:uncharacterized membrane protein YfcA
MITALPSDMWMALLGTLVGLVMALSGAGGGSIAVPLLMFGAHLSVQQAGAVSLLAVAFTAALGTALAWREGQVRYRAAALIGISGMLAAPLGVALAHRLPTSPLLWLFGGFMLYTAWRARRPAPSPTADQLTVCRREAGAIQLTWSWTCTGVLARAGAAAGSLSGLLGVGGGVLIVPALERASNLDLRSIQATSLAVMALVALSGVGAAAAHGQLPWALALPFAAGAVIGLMAGRRVGRHLPHQRLRQVFAAVAAVVALLVLARAAGLGV